MQRVYPVALAQGVERVRSMFDRARLKDFAPGEVVRAGAFQELFDEEAWIPIPVPGDAPS
jgi:hypothetical protein